MLLTGGRWHQRDFGSLLDLYSKITPGGCLARGSGVPRSDAKASGWRAMLAFPVLALAFPIFLPLPPSPKLQWQEQFPSGAAAPLPIPIASQSPRHSRELAEELVGSTGSCLFSRSIVPDAPSLR